MGQTNPIGHSCPGVFGLKADFPLSLLLCRESREKRVLSASCFPYNKCLSDALSTARLFPTCLDKAVTCSREGMPGGQRGRWVCGFVVCFETD